MSNNNTPSVTVEITAERAARLEQAFQWSRALGSPTRLAILGLVAARIKEAVAVEEIAAALQTPADRIDHDIQILAEAGLLRIEEWSSAGPRQEPRPTVVTFELEYLKAAPQVTAVLHRLARQGQPAAPAPVADERTRALGTLMRRGRLLHWPVQFKRQVWVTEEVAKAFQPGRTYTEREVDAILKDIFAYDHCTLRRFLVDLKLMHRENGVYWKAEPPTGAQAIGEQP